MILQAMQSTEDEVQSISAIARSSVAGQAFHTDVLAFPSQAKRTLERYSSGGYQSEGGNSTGYNSEGGYKSDESAKDVELAQKTVALAAALAVLTPTHG